MCQRKGYTLQQQWWADIFLVVTLEKHIESFSHLKAILSERTEVIQFGPNLPERQRPLQQLTFPFRNPNPLPEILKRWGTSSCTSVCDFQDEDGLGKPKFIIQSGETPTDAKLAVWRALGCSLPSSDYCLEERKRDSLKTQLTSEWLGFDFICCKEPVS